MAAVLALGDSALLSHRAAGALHGVCSPGPLVEVTVATGSHRERPGISIHRVMIPQSHCGIRDRIPVTSVVWTLVDLATVLSPRALEDAINEADRLDLIDSERLAEIVEEMPRRPGKGRLRSLLDRHTRTDSRLEKRFLLLAREIGMPEPLTQQWVNGHRVDFYWPDLGLVVETDGLRYHRTASSQARDIARDQDHLAAGLTPLRFTRDQVVNSPARVRRALVALFARLRP